MWAVCKKQNCRENGIRCGQESCEMCYYLSTVWNETGKGYKDKIGERLVNGSWKDITRWIPGRAEFPHGGWWEDNWRKQQIMIITNKKRKEKEQRAIQMNMGAGLKHVLWTINLPADYDLKTFQRQLEILIIDDKYQMGQSLGAIEFHSKEKPDGGKLHAHIVVLNHGTLKPTKKKEWLMKFFGIADNFVDYQPYRKPEDFQNAVNYVLGNKADEKKMVLVEKDRKWRDENQLPQITCGLPGDVYDKYVKNNLWFT